jgi:predicted ATPase
MRVIDSAPFVLEALANGPMNQGELTEAVWGTSGRGNRTLVNSLFPYLERRGLITITKRGRSIVYEITSKGRQNGPTAQGTAESTEATSSK